jgi:hypothetical protein
VGSTPRLEATSHLEEGIHGRISASFRRGAALVATAVTFIRARPTSKMPAPDRAGTSWSHVWDGEPNLPKADYKTCPLCRLPDSPGVLLCRVLRNTIMGEYRGRSFQVAQTE